MQAVVNDGILSPWEPGIFSLVIFGFLILALIALLLLVASRIGEKKPGVEKQRAYESGIIPTGSARLRYPVPVCDIRCLFTWWLYFFCCLMWRVPIFFHGPLPGRNWAGRAGCRYLFLLRY